MSWWIGVAGFVAMGIVPWVVRHLAIKEEHKSYWYPASVVVCIVVSGICNCVAGMIVSAFI